MPVRTLAATSGRIRDEQPRGEVHVHPLEDSRGVGGLHVLVDRGHPGDVLLGGLVGESRGFSPGSSAPCRRRRAARRAWSRRRRGSACGRRGGPPRRRAGPRGRGSPRAARRCRLGRGAAAGCARHLADALGERPAVVGQAQRAEPKKQRTMRPTPLSVGRRVSAMAQRPPASTLSASRSSSSLRGRAGHGLGAAERVLDRRRARGASALGRCRAARRLGGRRAGRLGGAARHGRAAGSRLEGAATGATRRRRRRSGARRPARGGAAAPARRRAAA